MDRVSLAFAPVAKYAAAFLLLLGSAQICCADHPDRSHRPAVAPERMLSGVYIDSSEHHSLRNEDGVRIEPISDVLEALGTPSKVVRLNRCENNYIWNRGDLLLEVGSGCVYQKVGGKDVMRTHGAYSVEVWGKRPEGSVGITGRGLALGDSMERVKRLYGFRCESGEYVSGTGTQNTHGEHYAHYAEYQWGDSVELDVDADAKGQVVHMLLRGHLE